MSPSQRFNTMLANEDSVLPQQEVKDSVLEYEKLFDGVRENVGTTSTEESVEKRSKEYQTLVNSYYNLVTDFYQMGWGQVRISKINPKFLILNKVGFHLYNQQLII